MAERNYIKIGIAGPVGSGKTALIERLCRKLYPGYSIGVITNDIYTKEDAEYLTQNSLLPAEIGISVSYPLPGTVFFEKVKNQLTEKSNWTDSDELALMFSNTYQPAFYKQLHSYVHKTYRKHIAFENIKQLLSHPFKSNFKMVKKALSAMYYMPAAYFDKQKLHQLEKPGVCI